MRVLIGYIGIGVIVVVFIAGFMAYFVTSVDPVTHQMSDGFGRELVESPMLVRFLFGQERLWVGWLWFVVDFIVFWGGMGLGFFLVTFGFKDKIKGVGDK